jgi:hypothetical protein
MSLFSALTTRIIDADHEAHEQAESQFAHHNLSPAKKSLLVCIRMHPVDTIKDLLFIIPGYGMMK